MPFPRFQIVVFPLIVGAVFGVGALAGARAQEPESFVVAANDGYGLEECLSGGLECGQVVADAWCEAHGHGAAISFGPQSRFANLASAIASAGEPFVINCGD